MGDTVPSLASIPPSTPRQTHAVLDVPQKVSTYLMYALQPSPDTSLLSIKPSCPYGSNLRVGEVFHMPSLGSFA
jgi:hypothetical protein